MRLGSSNGRDWLYREAGEEASTAIQDIDWTYDYATEAWRSPKFTAEGNTCSTCGEDLGSPQYHRARRCQCVEDIYLESFRAFVEEHKAKTAALEWHDAGFPDRYVNARFENFERVEGTEVALSAAEGWADGFGRDRGQSGLLLVGPFGCGKTHLATAAAYRALERTLVRPRFVSSVGLIRDTKGGDKLDHEPVRRAIAAELLVLDDLGQVGRTDFDRELLFSIISERYDAGEPILATSNLPPDRLGDLLGGAFASRLYEACEIVFLTAPDYRKAKRVGR
jgi:DNA replication protein DnaC